MWNRPPAPLGCKILNVDTSTEINAAFATFVRERAVALFVAPGAFSPTGACNWCNWRHGTQSPRYIRTGDQLAGGR
jgi:peroxiredoxin